MALNQSPFRRPLLFLPRFLVYLSTEGTIVHRSIGDPIQSSMEEAMDDAEDVSWWRGSDSLNLRIGAAAATAVCWCSFSGKTEATLLFPAAAAVPLKSET